MSNKVVEVDRQGRLPMAKVLEQKADRYLVEEHPDGTVVLTPAAVISEHELALLRNPNVLDQLVEGMSNPERAKPSRYRRPRTDGERNP